MQKYGEQSLPAIRLTCINFKRKWLPYYIIIIKNGYLVKGNRIQNTYALVQNVMGLDSDVNNL